MIEEAELAVVGAGPAGLEAALTAAESGVAVTLVDSFTRPGGQYLKQLPPSFSSDDRTTHQREAQEILLRLQSANNVHLLTDTLVWGAFRSDDGWQLALHGSDAPQELHAASLMLAPGAYDRPVAFPGWTLPGVMTAGAVQTLLKNQRVLPGRRMLVAGTGPLLLAVAAQLIEAGAEVVGVLEGTGRGKLLRAENLLGAWGQWSRLSEGGSYLRTMWQAHVPYRLGWSVMEARGEGGVREAVVARLDEQWRVKPGTAETLSVDTVVLGYGFLPATQLSRLLECEHDWEFERGGFVPRRGERMQTSQRGVYAVGDGAAIGGAALARLEGRMAGLSVAQATGHLRPYEASAAIAALGPSLARERRFARMLGRLFSPGDGIFDLANDDTLLCRCEDITLGMVKEAVAGGARSLNEIKGITRAGMGHCQGRVCGELVTRAIVDADRSSDSVKRQLEAVGAFTVRPPLYPLPLSVLAEAACADALTGGDRNTQA